MSFPEYMCGGCRALELLGLSTLLLSRWTMTRIRAVFGLDIVP